jgi:hypothetical protein
MRSQTAPPPSTRAEQELLLCCARTRLDAEAAGRLRQLLRQRLDWVHLLGSAERHRVTALVYWHVRAVNPESVPPQAGAVLRSAFEQNVRDNLAHTAELFRVLDLLQEHGILAIPYKGPIVAALAYGNLALREFSDLDILVRQRDVPRLWELLVAHGYRPGLDPKAMREAAPLPIPGQYPFQSPGGDLIEFHTGSTLRYFPIPLDFEALAARLEPVSLGGRKVLSLSAADALPLLCVHGSKHFWDRLGWIVDIAELAQLPSGLDWTRAFAAARAMDCEQMLLLGLSLAHDPLLAPIPEEILNQAQASAAVQRLAGTVRRRLFADRGRAFGALQRLLFRVRMRANLWKGLGYALRLLAQPTEEDWAMVPLPVRLWPMYSLLRPLRLLREHGVGLTRRVEPDLAPYDPTPAAVIDQMLALAELTPADLLYDLGCGDGRIVIAAAKRFGARGVGVDVHPQRIRQARASARKEGVAHKVKFVRLDLTQADLSKATVVTLYLSLVGNLKLREKLQEQLPPAARVVSRDFQIPGWVPLKTEKYQGPDGRNRTLYLWRVGAAPMQAV